MTGIEIVIMVLISMESGGDATAIGDGGDARGILQIHHDCWLDGCRFGGVDWDYETGSMDPIRSKQVCRWYLEHYGEGLPLDDLCRIWNGGPSGWKHTSTNAYYKEYMQRRYDDKWVSAWKEQLLVIAKRCGVRLPTNDIDLAIWISSIDTDKWRGTSVEVLCESIIEHMKGQVQ